MERHIKILGILHVAYAVVCITMSYGLMYVITRLEHLPGTIHRPAVFIGSHRVAMYSLVDFIGNIVLTYVLLVGLAGIIAGCGVLGRKYWARILITIVGIVLLLDFPFGTALGIYTLWVVFQPDTRRLMTA